MGKYADQVGRKSKPEVMEPFEAASPGSHLNEPCFINNLYQVTLVDHRSGWTHLSIVRRDRSATHDWRQLQTIKNELCGPEREGVEMYPRESRLVDTNNQYHLWVAPEGMTLPIGYTVRDVSDRTFGKHRQRPFAEPPEDLNAHKDLPPDGMTTVMFPTPMPEDEDDETVSRHE